MQQYFGRKFDKMEKTERECEGTQEECDLMDGFILKGDIGWSVSKDEMRTVSGGYLVCAEGDVYKRQSPRCSGTGRPGCLKRRLTVRT